MDQIAPRGATPEPRRHKSRIHQRGRALACCFRSRSISSRHARMAVSSTPAFSTCAPSEPRPRVTLSTYTHSSTTSTQIVSDEAASSRGRTPWEAHRRRGRVRQQLVHRWVPCPVPGGPSGLVQKIRLGPGLQEDPDTRESARAGGLRCVVEGREPGLGRRGLEGCTRQRGGALFG